jgi:hypothetical protein
VRIEVREHTPGHVHDPGTGRARAVTFIRVPAHDTDRAAAYEDWYDNVHIPVRLSMPGFLGAQRYDMLEGRQRYFVLYELADAGVVTGEKYVAQREWERQQPADSFEAPALSRPGFERGFYDQTSGPEWPAEAIRSPFVHVLGLHPPSDDAKEAQNVLSTHHVPTVAALPGVVASRMFEVSAQEVGSGTGMHGDYPRLMVVTYATELAAVTSPGFASAVDAASSSIGLPPSDAYVVIGKLALSRSARAFDREAAATTDHGDASS